MNYRIAQMQDNVNVLSVNPPAEDITYTDIVSRFAIVMGVKNPTAVGAGYLDHMSSILTKVEIVDGSDVLVSLTGKRLLGMNFWDKKGKLYNKTTGQYNTSGRVMFDIDFGRYLWDPVLGFDATKFKNPQLKLTFDDTVYHASVQSLTYDLYAYLFDEKRPTPSGFLMRKEVETWTPTANAWKTVDMPTDYPYRQLFIYGYGTAKGIPHAVEEFVLSENLDKRKPIEIYTKDLMYLLGSEYDMFREYIESGDTATSFYVVFSEDMRALMNANTATAVGIGADGNKLTVTPAAGGDTHHGFAIGQLPMHMIPILVQDQMDMDDWYNVVPLTNLKLKCRAKNETMVAPAAGVYLEQYRPY